MQKIGLITGYPGWLTGRFINILGGKTNCDWQEELKEYSWRAVVAPHVSMGDVALDNISAFYTADIRQTNALREAFKNVDIVLHAAGIIHPRRIDDLYSINRDGTKNLVRLALENGVRRFVFISSNAAAGFALGPEVPMNEDDSPRPESHYGKSKLYAEKMLWEEIREDQMQGVVLRPTTFYGPFFPRRHLKAYIMAKSGRPFLIGSGKNQVSMVYIDNMVDCVGRALTRNEAVGETFFVADEDPYLWREVFLAIGEALEVEVSPCHLPRVIAPLCNYADRFLSYWGLYSLYVHIAGEATRHMSCRIDKAKKELGYCPIVRLHEGMRKAVEWARIQGWL